MADDQERLDKIPLYRQDHEQPRTVQITLSDTPVSKEEAQAEKATQNLKQEKFIGAFEQAKLQSLKEKTRGANFDSTPGKGLKKPEVCLLSSEGGNKAKNLVRSALISIKAPGRHFQPVTEFQSCPGMIAKKHLTEQSVPCSPKEERARKSFDCSSVTSNESGPIVVKLRLSSSKPNQTIQAIGRDLTLSERQQTQSFSTLPELVPKLANSQAVYSKQARDLTIKTTKGDLR